MSNATVSNATVSTTPVSNAAVDRPTLEPIQQRLRRSRLAFARRNRTLAETARRVAKETRAVTADYASFVTTEGQRWRRFARERREALRSTAVERALLLQLHHVLESAQQHVANRVAELERPGLATTSAEGEGADSVPLVDYETMNARAVVSALDEVDLETCRAVEAYEQAHKNRVTVLRAVRRRLAA